MSLLCALSLTVGPRAAASASSSMKVEVTRMLNWLTIITPMMLVYGKSTARTGMLATVAEPLVVSMKTYLVLRRFSNGEVIPGNTGLHVDSVDAVLRKWKKLFY